MLKPKLFTTIKEYSWDLFVKDLGAGLIVGVIALPLAIAFAIASGVEPERGLYTAIIGGIAISFLGGSRYQIGGPTGAFVVIVYGIVQRFGYPGLMTATIMAGILLVGMGLLKLGGLIKFIPYSIIVGFTSGIAVIICASQLGDFMGLDTGPLPADFIGKIEAYAGAIASLDWASLALGAGCLAFLFIWPKLVKGVPGALVAIILSTVAVLVFKLPVDTIGSRFGSIPSGLPSPTLPDLNLSTILKLLPSAGSIAFLAAIESLLSAAVADGMASGRHRPNMELVAQGAANILSPIFGGIPATGAIARTAANIKNGGRTPVAGIVHGLTLLAIMLAFGRYVVYIPMPALAAVLIQVAWNMSEMHAFRAVLKGPRSDAAILLVTFLLTVFEDLTVAIGAGMVLTTLVFIKKMADSSSVTRSASGDEGEWDEKDDPNRASLRKIPKGVLVFEIDGPFFFGSVQKLEEALARTNYPYKVLILRMRRATYLDPDGIKAIDQLHSDCRKHGRSLIVSDIHSQPYMLAVKCGLEAKLGGDRIFGNLDAALAKAAELVGEKYQGEPGVFPPTVAREGAGGPSAGA
jgi:SulP family sulfate permease